MSNPTARWLSIENPLLSPARFPKPPKAERGRVLFYTYHVVGYDQGIEWLKRLVSLINMAMVI
jgi:hypothetical protein